MMETYTYKLKPVEGCEDCETLTEAYDKPTTCYECFLDQMEEAAHSAKWWKKAQLEKLDSESEMPMKSKTQAGARGPLVN